MFSPLRYVGMGGQNPFGSLEISLDSTCVHIVMLSVARAIRGAAVRSAVASVSAAALKPFSVHAFRSLSSRASASKDLSSMLKKVFSSSSSQRPAFIFPSGV